MKILLKYNLALLFISVGLYSSGQFNATNIAEFQRGNLPGSMPDDLLTFYDQLNLNYRLKNIRLSGTVEHFNSSADNPYEYIQLSQLSANYRNKGLTIKLGSYYETLGRGLLLRAYEIKNSIIEDRIYRSRQGFYKDLLGFSTNYRIANFQFTALYGKMLNNQLPAQHPERRLDQVAGGELSYRFKAFTLGGIYLNHQLQNNTKHFASVHFEGNIWNNLNIYSEVARDIPESGDLLNLSTTDRYGMYMSMNYSLNNFGLSVELKNYHQFTIGSGIADAPTLVKEHSYRLLNRSTHIAEFLDERGYQIEAYYHFKNQSLLTLNHAFASNTFGTTNYNFHEFFFEYYLPKPNWQLKTFIDLSADAIVSETGRFSTGAYLSYIIRNDWSLNLETEYQHITRSEDKFSNLYIGLIASRSTKISAGFIYELSTDPYLLENDAMIKTFPGITASYQITTKQNMQLFAGSRRGGPACTSGICYEVLDFKGIELRYILKI